MPMMPKRVKFRKSQRGKMKGNATRGNYVSYGEYGLQSLDSAWIPAKTLEAARAELEAARAPKQLGSVADVAQRPATPSSPCSITAFSTATAFLKAFAVTKRRGGRRFFV